MDKPIYGVQYALTGATGTPCIANGNTREESRVTDTDREQAELIKKYDLGPLTITDMNGKSEVIPTIADDIAKNTPIEEVNKQQYPYKWTGSKFGELGALKYSTKIIAKLVRDEINSKFPKKQGYNISTRYESFSGGSAIEISIKATPFKGLTDEYLLALQTNDRDAFNRFENSRAYGQQTRYTADMCLLIDTLKNIQNQYNFDDSDSQSDYFSVNYYGNVQVSSDYHKLLSSNQVF